SSDFAKEPEPLYASFKGNDHVRVPNVRGMGVEAARSVLKAHGFHMEQAGRGSVVGAQHPDENTFASRRTVINVTLVSLDSDSTDGMIRVPDVVGMSLRQAMNFIKGMKLEPSPVGSGVVRTQYPAAGSFVPRGSRCTLDGESRTVSANLY
ncbi:MAG: PASTA domain-containing protein, partial [Bacteroidota bacterium]|nr:PASTA domain-containing protein [Bacteroidota bacterium]